MGHTAYLAYLLLLISPQDPLNTAWDNVTLAANIEAAIHAGRPVVLPKVTILTDTVDLRRISGLKFQGAGQLYNYPQYRVSDPPIAAPVIVWRGPPDKPVFLTAGIGCSWEGVNFVFESPALAGIQVVKGQGIAGGGKHVIDRCSFLQNREHSQKTIGILCGTAVGDSHCDCLTIRSCIAVDCKSLLTTLNNMSLNHALYGNLTVRCETALNFEAGGKVSVFGHGSVSDLCVLQLGRQGSNNNSFEIYGLSVDAQVPADFVLVRSRLRPHAQYVTISGKLSGSAQKTAEELLDFLGPTLYVDLSRLSGVRASQ